MPLSSTKDSISDRGIISIRQESDGSSTVVASGKSGPNGPLDVFAVFSNVREVNTLKGVAFVTRGRYSVSTETVEVEQTPDRRVVVRPLSAESVESLLA
jgi:hypothetical protein